MFIIQQIFAQSSQMTNGSIEEIFFENKNEVQVIQFSSVSGAWSLESWLKLENNKKEVDSTTNYEQKAA